MKPGKHLQAIIDAAENVGDLQTTVHVATLKAIKHDVDVVESALDCVIEERDEALDDVDEARRWARKYYALYLDKCDATNGEP